MEGKPSRSCIQMLSSKLLLSEEANLEQTDASARRLSTWTLSDKSTETPGLPSIIYKRLNTKGCISCLSNNKLH